VPKRCGKAPAHRECKRPRELLRAACVGGSGTEAGRLTSPLRGGRRSRGGKRLARGTDDAFDFLTEDGIAVEGSAARDGCGGQMMRMARRGRSSPGATASVTIAARSNARAPRCRR
jgi:hypothetical protein